MRSYASLSPMFWTRGSGKRLRGQKEAQLVALYLMSSPATNMIGIFHLTLPTLCHDTGLTAKEALKGLASLSKEAFAFWDEAEELVFVPALAKHQIGEELKEKDFKVKGVIRALAPYKGHRFYSMFIERYADGYHLPFDDSESPSEGASKSHVTGDYVPVPDLDQISDAVAERNQVAEPKPARWKRFPRDFVPNDAHRELAASLGVDLDYQMELIVDHQFDKPKTDPIATLRTWIRNAPTFGTATRPRTVPSRTTSSEVIVYDPGHS